jgi:predicted dehydrogenase
VHVKQEKHVVKAIVGHRKESTVKFKKKHKIEFEYYSIEDLVKSQTVDNVYVATPHHLHFEQTMKLLDARIPVLCEKPLAINKEQLSALVNKSKEKKTFLMEGIWTSCLPSIHKVVEHIKTDSIGRVNSITASMSYIAPYDITNRYFNPELGGGSLLDLGIYPVYLSYLLLGKPTEIKAVAKLAPTQVDAATAAMLTYANGAYAVLESSFIKKSPNEAIIYGEKGFIKIAEPWQEMPASIIVKHYDGSFKQKFVPNWKGRGLQYEVEEMMKCLKNKQIESSLLSHETSLHLVEILDEIRMQTKVKYLKYDNE